MAVAGADGAAPVRLTRRQREVVELLARGMSNRDIARELYISERTAEGHVRQLCNLLGVNSRTQVAVWWTGRLGAGEPGAEAAPAEPGRVVALLCDPVPATRSAAPDDPGRDRVAALVARWVERHGGCLAAAPPAGRQLAVFARAADAVAAALDVQLAVALERWPGETRWRVRMALDLGESQAVDGTAPADLVERCGRLVERARPRQVLASAAAAVELVGALPDGVQLWQQAAPAAADAGQAAAFQVVAAGDRPWPARPAGDRPPTNLPLSLTAFVGRERELAELRALRGAHRLVTLLGIGGGGKTRLAMELGREVLDEHADGVWLVDLSAVADGRLVPQCFAAALGVREQAGRACEDTVLDHLRGRGLTLIPDCCEHVLGAVAELVERILAACPDVWVVATSREPLRVAGEVRYRVPPLSHPGDGSAPADGYEAVRLFVDRARSVLPGFEAGPADAAVLGRICHRLDGIPLAIELAAGWTHVLGVDGILDRLEDRFRLLTSEMRGTPARQRTLAAALDWSHELLDEGERTLLRRLGVFSGGFALADVEGVCLAPDGSPPDALPLVTSLVDKSLVVVGDGRYRCLETVREYALARLAEAGELEVLARRHAEWFARAVRDREPGRLAPWLGGLDRDAANVRAALAWSAEHDAALAVEIATAVFPHWQLRGRVTEARQALEALVRSAEEPSDVRGRALAMAAAAAYLQNDGRAGVAWIDEALALLRGRDVEAVGFALRVRGQLWIAADDLAAAEGAFEDAMDHWRQREDTVGEAQALHDLGQIAGLRGELAAARALYERSLDLRTELGIREEAHVTLTFLSLLSLLAGDRAGARPALMESLASARRLQDHRAAWALDVRACLAAADGDARLATVLAAAAAAMHRAAGTATPAAWSRLTRGWLEPARAALSSDAAEAARAEGEALSFDGALELALRG